MNLVSVIIPYFNKKNYILETVNSVLNQTYKNLEIIIVYDDENKTDIQYLNQIKNKDKRVKLVINDKTLGAGFARNKGIKLSKGDYIAFIDADDVWIKNKIKKQLNFMKNNNYLITHTSYNIIDIYGKIVGKRKARNFLNKTDLLKSCDIGLSTVMLDKSILCDECKFPKLKTKEDFVLWLKILEKNISIFSLNETLTSWRKTANSLSSSTIQKLLDGYRVYKNYMNFNRFKSLYYLFCLGYNYLRK